MGVGSTGSPVTTMGVGSTGSRVTTMGLGSTGSRVTTMGVGSTGSPGTTTAVALEAAQAGLPSSTVVRITATMAVPVMVEMAADTGATIMAGGRVATDPTTEPAEPTPPLLVLRRRSRRLPGAARRGVRAASWS
jgi:hypothetical protein